MNEFNFSQEVIAITGGGGLLCGQMAKVLSQYGSKIAILENNLEKAKKICDEINAHGGKALPIYVNVNQKKDFEQALDQILDTFGIVTGLINGAGINSPTPFFEISEEEWDSIVDSHLKGTFFGCQVFGKYLVQKKKGAILNMSSASSGPPLSKAFAYSAAKAAIKNLTQNLAREWGQTGVRVNALRPGFFPTEWSQKHFIDERRREAIFSHTPMKRFGEASELNGAVLWLMSPQSTFVTGAEIEVDGGFSAMTI